MKRIVSLLVFISIFSFAFAAEGPVHFKVDTDTGNFYNPDSNQSFFVIQHDNISADELLKAYSNNCLHLAYVYPFLHQNNSILKCKLEWRFSDDNNLICNATLDNKRIGVNCGCEYWFDITYKIQFKDGRTRIDAELKKVHYISAYDELKIPKTLQYKEDWFTTITSIYEMGEKGEKKRVEALEKAVNGYINGFISQLFSPSVTDWDNAITWSKDMLDLQVIQMANNNRTVYKITDKEYINVKVDGFNRTLQTYDAYFSSLKNSVMPFLQKQIRDFITGDIRALGNENSKHENIIIDRYDNIRVVHYKFYPRNIQGLGLLDMEYCIIFRNDVIKIYPPRFVGYTLGVYKKDGTLSDKAKAEDRGAFNRAFYQNFIYLPLYCMWQVNHQTPSEEEVW